MLTLGNFTLHYIFRQQRGVKTQSDDQEEGGLGEAEVILLYKNRGGSGITRRISDFFRGYIFLGRALLTFSI
jgi:hypothetical protein